MTGAELDVTTGEIIAVAPAAPPPSLFGTDDPAAVLEKATAVADVLAGLIRSKGLASMISGREYVRVEGWTTLGAMLGVGYDVEWTRELAEGWEARVVVRHLASGSVIGSAEAECTRSERTWKSRDSYALRSMAQTRAISKALRMPLGFVMVLAGYEATPAEEIPRDEPGFEPERKAPTPDKLASSWAGRLEELDRIAAVEPGVSAATFRSIVALAWKCEPAEIESPAQLR
jgi:hypothetical protein